MPSSRLFELLAEAKARPTGGFQDFTAAMNAGDSIVDTIKGVQETRLGRTKLGDIFGATSDVATRFPNMRLKDLERKGLSDLIKAELENTPSDLLIPDVDPDTGLPTGRTMNLGTFSKRTKVLPPPNVFKMKELTLAEKRAAEERRKAHVKELQDERDALIEQKKAYMVEGVGFTTEENKPRVAALQRRIDSLDRQIGGSPTPTVGTTEPTVPPPAPAQMTPPAPLPATKTPPSTSKVKIGQSFANPKTGEVATWDGKKWVITQKKK